MERASAAKPLILSAKDEDILKAISAYRYMTMLDVAHLLFRPSIISYVRGRLARLAGGKDLQESAFLCRFQLPSTSGNKERIYTLGSKGREFLQSSLGHRIDWQFSPGRVRFFTYSTVLHHLLLTRFLVACQHWSRTSAYKITELRVSYDLARTPPKVTVTEKNKKTTLTVIPDAWVKFDELEEGTRKSSLAVLFELDRGMEHQQQFKQHVKARVEFVRSGVYQKTFGVPGVVIAYATTGQTPEYRHTRARTISNWTMDVLQELKLQNWAALFRFTAIEFDSLYKEAQSLFEEAVWLRPDMKEKVRLFA